MKTGHLSLKRGDLKGCQGTVEPANFDDPFFIPRAGLGFSDLKGCQGTVEPTNFDDPFFIPRAGLGFSDL